MFLLRLAIIPVLFLSVCQVRGQDGEQLYGLYCSACHAPDGKGATGGVFPPLADSEWIHGNPMRAVAIVLKGLHGPVEVVGITYNLEMPPQGDALGDEQIVAILNYVHNAWGNQGEKVNIDLVRTTRAEFQGRSDHWTAAEILKLFPLKKKNTPLANLTSRVYKGQWSRIPDFETLQAENVEEEHGGILDTAAASLKEDFGIVWEADFIAPESGEYSFSLDADDGARVLLNGHPVCVVDGIGPMGSNSRISKGKTTLNKGAHPIRIEYMQRKAQQGISLGWKPNGAKQWQWVSANTPKSMDATAPIQLTPKEGKTIIYRNFIQGSTPRGIGIGFPGGVNMVYSADHLAPELLWAGDFIDAARHWTNRGQGFQPPSADKVITLTKQRFHRPDAK